MRLKCWRQKEKVRSKLTNFDTQKIANRIRYSLWLTHSLHCLRSRALPHILLHFPALSRILFIVSIRFTFFLRSHAFSWTRLHSPALSRILTVSSSFDSFHAFSQFRLHPLHSRQPTWKPATPKGTHRSRLQLSTATGDPTPFIQSNQSNRSNQSNQSN
jgi:hypothetical protein